jgi:hypothetical protein
MLQQNERWELSGDVGGTTSFNEEKEEGMTPRVSAPDSGGYADDPGAVSGTDLGGGHPATNDDSDGLDNTGGGAGALSNTSDGVANTAYGARALFSNTIA